MFFSEGIGYMTALILLSATVNDVIGGLLATMAFDPGTGAAMRAATVQSCGAPSPVFAALIRSDKVDLAQFTTPSASSQAISRAPDGLFYVDAIVNGAPVRFLIDTGATTIVLTKKDAARAGVLPVAEAFNAIANTAGGDTAMARIRLARISVGHSIDFDVPAAVAQGNLGVSLLGASWLTQVGSVTITGDRMVLQ